MKDQHSNSDRCTFELLSAYLDGEVTASERQQVQEWLATDSEIRSLYGRLQLMRDRFQSLPHPQPTCSHQDLANNVFAKIDQRSKTRKRWFVGGGSAIAALVVATVGNVFSESNSPVLRFAQQPEEEALVIALNRPVIDIPPEKQQSEEEESLMIPINHSLFEMPE